MTELDTTEPRFLDPLEPELEAKWQEIAQALAYIGHKQFMAEVSIWQDVELPTAFSDRAMLALAGNGDVREELGLRKFRDEYVTTWPINSLAEHVLEKSGEVLDYETLANWFRSARQYSKETGKQFFYDWQLQNWGREFFKRGLISESEYDEIVAEYLHDPAKTTKVELFRHRVNQATVFLGGFLFPDYDDDIERPPTKDKVLRKWALNKLNEWLKHQLDESYEIPEWLAAIPKEIGDNMIINLGRNAVQGHYNFKLDDLSSLVIDTFGWDDFIKNISVFEKLAKTPNDLSARKLELILHYVSTLEHPEFLISYRHPEHVEHLEAIANKFKSKELLKLVSKIKSIHRNEIQSQQREHEKRQQALAEAAAAAESDPANFLVEMTEDALTNTLQELRATAW